LLQLAAGVVVRVAHHLCVMDFLAVLAVALVTLALLAQAHLVKVLQAELEQTQFRIQAVEAVAQVLLVVMVVAQQAWVVQGLQTQLVGRQSHIVGAEVRQLGLVGVAQAVLVEVGLAAVVGLLHLELLTQAGVAVALVLEQQHQVLVVQALSSFPTLAHNEVQAAQ
jgi:hypothetical protein